MLEIQNGYVRALKGAPLAVLVLIQNSPQPVSMEWLARTSGYTDKPVSQACKYLQEIGLVTHTEHGWCSAARLNQSQAGLEDAVENQSEEWDEDEDVDDDDYEQDQDDDGDDAQAAYGAGFGGRYETRNNSDPLNNSNNPLKSKAFKDSRLNTTITGQPKQKKSEAERDQIWVVLNDLGINHNARTNAMVELPHVSPSYIRAVARKLELSGRSMPQHAGLLIQGCEKAWKVDEGPALSGQRVVDLVDEFFHRRT